MDQCRRMTFERKEEEEQLESDRQNKADRQQRKRWRPIFRELKRKIPYYIVGVFRVEIFESINHYSRFPVNISKQTKSI